MTLLESTEPPDPGLSLFLVPIFVSQISYPGLAFGIVVLCLLLALSALVSGSEVAYFSLSPNDLRDIANDEKPNAKRILRLREHPRQLLATILIANNFVNIGIVILSEYLIRMVFAPAVFLQWAEGLANVPLLGLVSQSGLAEAIKFLLTVVAATFLLVLLGEVAPKIYSNINNKRMAMLMATPLTFLNTFFRPLSGVLVRWSTQLENRLGQEAGYAKSRKDDLDKAIELTVSHEQNSEKEIDILKSIVKFGEVTAKQIMRSRVDVVAVDITSSFQELMKIVKDCGYSRIPVFEEDFDNIRGILYVKDLLVHLNDGDKDLKWQKLIRTEVKYVPEAKKINELLTEFQQERTHIAIVVDEFGGSGGLVTLEDVMEEVIGEIRDEFDDEDEVEYEKLDNHNFIFEGKTLLNDMCRVVGIDTDSFDAVKGDADSVAGLLLEMIGKIPKKNSDIRYKRYRFKILEVNEKRISRIQITIP